MTLPSSFSGRIVSELLEGDAGLQGVVMISLNLEGNKGRWNVQPLFSSSTQ